MISTSWLLFYFSAVAAYYNFEMDVPSPSSAQNNDQQSPTSAGILTFTKLVTNGQNQSTSPAITANEGKIPTSCNNKTDCDVENQLPSSSNGSGSMSCNIKDSTETIDNTNPYMDNINLSAITTNDFCEINKTSSLTDVVDTIAAINAFEEDSKKENCQAASTIIIRPASSQLASVELKFNSTLVSDINNKFNTNEKCDSSALVSDSDLQIIMNKKEENNTSPNEIMVASDQCQSSCSTTTGTDHDNIGNSGSISSEINGECSSGAKQKDLINNIPINIDDKLNQDRINTIWNKGQTNSDSNNQLTIDMQKVKNIDKAEEITSAIPVEVATVTRAMSVEPTNNREKNMCDSVITDISKEKDYCDFDQHQENNEKCFEGSIVSNSNISNTVTKIKCDIRNGEVIDNHIVDHNNITQLKCDRNFRTVEDKVCAKNQNTTTVNSVVQHLGTNININLKSRADMQPTPSSTNYWPHARSFHSDNNAVPTNYTQQQPRYADDLADRSHSHKMSFPFAKADRRQSLDHRLSHTERFRTDKTSSHTAPNVNNLDSSALSISQPSNVLKANSLYVSNPDFTKHRHSATKDLSPLRMKPPDFSKVSQQHYNSSPDIMGTSSEIVMPPSKGFNLTSMASPHNVNQSNFAEISKKYNYISDLQLKNPTQPDDANIKNNTFNSMYVNSPDFTKSPQRQVESLLRQKQHISKQIYPEPIPSLTSSVDEPTAHIIHKNQYMQQHAGETSSLYKSFPQISHDVTMSIVSPSHQNQYNDLETASKPVAAKLRASVSVAVPQQQPPPSSLASTADSQQSSNDASSNIYRTTEPYRYDMRNVNLYMQHHSNDMESATAKTKVYQKPKELPSTMTSLEQYSKHNQFTQQYQHSKFHDGSSKEIMSRSNPSTHHIEHPSESLINRSSKKLDTLPPPPRQQHHSATNFHKSTNYHTHQTEYIRQTYQNAYGYPSPHPIATHQHQPATSHSQSKLMRQHNQTIIPKGFAGETQMMIHQPSKPLSSHTKLMDTGGREFNTHQQGQMHPPQNWPPMAQGRANASPISLSSSPVNNLQNNRISQSPLGASSSPHNAAMTPSPSYVYTTSSATPSPSQFTSSAPSPVHFKQTLSSSHPSSTALNIPAIPNSYMPSNYSGAMYHQKEFSSAANSRQGHFQATTIKSEPTLTSSATNRDYYDSSKSRGNSNKMLSTDYVDLTKMQKTHEMYNSSTGPMQSISDQYPHFAKYPPVNERNCDSITSSQKSDGRYTQSKTIMDPYVYRQTSETDLNYEIIKKTLNKDISIRRSDADLSRSIFDNPKTASVPPKQFNVSSDYHNSSYYPRTNCDNREEYPSVRPLVDTQSSSRNLNVNNDSMFGQRRSETETKHVQSSIKVQETKTQPSYKPSNEYDLSLAAQSPRSTHRYDVPFHLPQKSSGEISRHDLSVTVSRISASRSKQSEKEIQRTDHTSTKNFGTESTQRGYCTIVGEIAHQSANYKKKAETIPKVTSIPSKNTISSTTKPFRPVKRESPLDLSVKTVKNIADSTGCDDYNLPSSSRRRDAFDAQSLKVDFAPNFEKHTAIALRSSVEHSRVNNVQQMSHRNHQPTMPTENPSILLLQPQEQFSTISDQKLYHPSMYDKMSHIRYQPSDSRMVPLSNTAACTSPLIASKTKLVEQCSTRYAYRAETLPNVRKYQEPQKPGLVLNPPVPTVFGRKPEELKNLPPINYTHQTSYPHPITSVNPSASLPSKIDSLKVHSARNLPNTDDYQMKTAFEENREHMYPIPNRNEQFKNYAPVHRFENMEKFKNEGAPSVEQHWPRDKQKECDIPIGPNEHMHRNFKNSYYQNSYAANMENDKASYNVPTETPGSTNRKRPIDARLSDDQYYISKKSRMDIYSTASHTYYPPIGYPSNVQKCPPPQFCKPNSDSVQTSKRVPDTKYENTQYPSPSTVKHMSEEHRYYEEADKDACNRSRQLNTQHSSLISPTSAFVPSQTDSFLPKPQTQEQHDNYYNSYVNKTQSNAMASNSEERKIENALKSQMQPYQRDKNTWYPPAGQRVSSEHKFGQHGDSNSKLSELSTLMPPTNTVQTVVAQQQITTAQPTTSVIQNNENNHKTGGYRGVPSFHEQSRPNSILKGADQNVISKLRTNLEQKEIEKQKLMKFNASTVAASDTLVDDDSSKSDIALLIAARIRTKGELKGFTPIQSSVDVPPVERPPSKVSPLPDEEDMVPATETKKPQTFQPDLHTTTCSDMDNSSSAFDLMDWGSACNDFVEQLQNGGTKKRGRRKRRTKSSTVHSDTMLNDELPLDNLPGMDYNCQIKDDLMKIIKTEEFDLIDANLSPTKATDVTRTGPSSSDEDKPLLLLRQQSLSESTTTGKIRSESPTKVIEENSVSTDKISETKKRQQREKREQEKLQSLTSSSSDSDNDDSTKKLTPKRSKKVTRKLRSRVSIGILSTTSEDTTDTEPVMIPKKATSSETFFVNSDKRKNADIWSANCGSEWIGNKTKIQKLDEADDKEQNAIADPLAITSQKKNDETAEMSGNNDSDIEKLTVNKTEVCSPLVISPSKNDATMTRSKRKCELNNQLINSSIVLRNDKHVKTSPHNSEAKKSSSKCIEKAMKRTPTKLLKMNSTKIDEIKRKIIYSETDDESRSPIIKKRTSRIVKLESSTSEQDVSDNEEMVSERLRSKKFKSDIAEVTVDKSPAIKSPEKFQEKKWSRGTPKKSVYTPQKATMTAAQFPDGWEEQVYEYKRSLKIPASLITVGRPPTHRKSVSLPDLDPHSSDASETFAENRRIKSATIDVIQQPAKRGRPSKVSQMLANAQLSTIATEIVEQKSKSIIDLLHQRVIRPVKNSQKKLKLLHIGPKILPQSTEVELLPTPGAEGTDVFKKHHNVFETAVLKSRTRKQYRVQKNQEIIREVFGGDVRPASAPPDQTITATIGVIVKIEPDIKPELVTFDQKYKQYLEKMNIDFGEKIRKCRPEDIAAVVIKMEPVEPVKLEDDSMMLMNQDDETQDTELNECDRNSEDIKEEVLDMVNERDTPSAMSERDGMTPNTLKFFQRKKGRGNRSGRRKGSSGECTFNLQFFS